MGDFSKLINLDLLTYYDSKKKAREDAKVKSVYMQNKSEVIAKFFAANRDGKIYGVKFAKSATGVIQAASGVKYGANEGLVVLPSTRTVAARNDYTGINVFKHIEANVHFDDTGEIVVDYIQGEDGFSYTGKVDVVCIFAALYERVFTETVEGIEYFCIEWTDTPRPGFTLNNLCYTMSGKNRGWYCITKFQSGLIDGNLYSSAGIRTWTNAASHNACLTKFHARSNYMSAMAISQMTTIQRMFMMKYAHTNYENKLGGLTNYYYQGYAIQTSTTNKDYIILLTTNANNLSLYSMIDVGTGASRGNTTFNVFCNTEVLSKDTNILLFKNVISNLTISDTNYSSEGVTQDFVDLLCVKPTVSDEDAEVIDAPDTKIKLKYTSPDDGTETIVEFTPKINISGTTYTITILDENDNIVATSGAGLTTCTKVNISDSITVTNTQYVSTAIYKSGYSLKILGEDGAYQRGDYAVSQRFPSVISGIELLTGAYDVIGNAIFNYQQDTSCNILVQTDPTQLSSTSATITSTYKNAGKITHTTTNNSWKYIGDISYDLESGAPTLVLDTGSSTNGLCDAVYYLGSQKSGLYEVRAFGSLLSGDPYGPFCLDAPGALSTSNWYIGARAAFCGLPLI